ncbi:MAG TPA: homoserine O-acetyltransferase [Candidatus Hydrogenedentes bacterium]|nr:homoserine O-acetyltransferase [Candidatus Hydrogenedentota bacterium]
MPETGSVGIVTAKYYTFAEPPNAMVLESGAKLGPITLAYETYGQLNPDRSNAVLICHALSGDAHVAGKYHSDDKKSGWWDEMVGPGKAFDTEKYFVICSNVIGGCMGSTGSSSINPATGKPYGLDFPLVTIGDMVRAQAELVRYLGIDQLLAVAGGSMGGMQALDWATRFPDRVRAVIIIAASYHNGAQQIAFHAVGRHAIQSDEEFKNGQYYEGGNPASGLGIARMLAHITYLSDESMNVKFGRRLRGNGSLRFDLGKEFSVESYLDYQGEQFVNRFDANTYLYISKAIDYFDLTREYGSLDAAMTRIRAKTLVLSFSSDWLYPPRQSEEIVYALARQGKDVTYCNIQSDYGHDAFLLEFEVLTKILDGFLKHTLHPERPCTRCIENADKQQFDPPAAAPNSIYSGRRVDYDLIEDLVEENSRVLDIGSGSGELLCRLDRRKKVHGLGLELSQDHVVSAIGCGIAVVQADIDKGLESLPDQSFDYVILSMTLQVLKHPDLVLREMLRVGKKCIVSFPNFGLWRVRLKALALGRAPVTRNLPYAWYQSPNRHVLTIKDFREFCTRLNIRIQKEIPLTTQGVAPFWPNLFAEEALYVISRES